ncbi:MAG: dihydrofolate reductase [Candidatus Thermoplasmatota archaeon]|nr:dihydrofolate reductase [Candidatus Thermoplasmatota archaeon]|tara:strand:- start:84 stop:548 length:465 start_codon:yes stop_codon:yes gene_type:complete
MKGILVAVSPEGIIGKNNTIPWHYSADLKRFKRLTTGKTIIMGRKTWESLPVKPLPNRRNIVISRSSLENVDCFRSIDEALETCEGDIWFIGGAGIYEEAMLKSDVIDMTLVPDNISGEGCIHFPKIGIEWIEGETKPLKEDTKLMHKNYTRRV